MTPAYPFIKISLVDMLVKAGMVVINKRSIESQWFPCSLKSRIIMEKSYIKDNNKSIKAAGNGIIIIMTVVIAIMVMMISLVSYRDPLLKAVDKHRVSATALYKDSGIISLLPVYIMFELMLYFLVEHLL